jgi:hypothetical protein
VPVGFRPTPSFCFTPDTDPSAGPQLDRLHLIDSCDPTRALTRETPRQALPVVAGEKDHEAALYRRL